MAWMALERGASDRCLVSSSGHQRRVLSRREHSTGSRKRVGASLTHGVCISQQNAYARQSGAQRCRDPKYDCLAGSRPSGHRFRSRRHTDMSCTFGHAADAAAQLARVYSPVPASYAYQRPDAASPNSWR